MAMGMQLFVFGHRLNGFAYRLDALRGEMLERNFAAEAIEADTAIGCSIAMRGKCVVGAACIVASTLAGVGA